jgi:hypothetical protein
MSLSNNTLAYNFKTGKLISVGEVQQNEEGIQCIDPSCRLSVFARRGDKNEWHFAHHQTDTPCPGKGNNGESLDHYEKKHLIAKDLEKFVFAKQTCYCCTRTAYHTQTTDLIPEVEGLIPGSLYRADVLLSTPAGVGIYAIEVKNFSRVSDEKRTWCTENNIIIIEISVDAIAEAIKHPLKNTSSKLQSKHAVRFIVHDLTQVQDEVCEDCRVAGRKEDPNWKNNRAMVVQRGLKKARTWLASRPTTKETGKIGSWKGPCKKCTEVIYTSNVPRPMHVIAQDFTKKEWYALFINTDKKYRRPYRNGRVLLCGRCVAGCLACNEAMPIDTMAKFGICSDCMNNFSST